MRGKILGLLLFAVFTIVSVGVKAESEERNVGAFTEISLRIHAKLHLEQGKDQSVEIVGKPASLGKIITEIRGDKLIIRTSSSDQWFKSVNLGKIEIFVTMPTIEGVHVAGSGTIIGEGEIKSTSIDLSVSGSGDVHLEELMCEKVNAAISGSGNVILDKGTAKEVLNVKTSGSGDVRAPRFQAQDIIIKVSGSGNCYVFAKNQLKARILGSGNVYYSGTARIDSSVTGSGKVIEAR